MCLHSFTSNFEFYIGFVTAHVLHVSSNAVSQGVFRAGLVLFAKSGDESRPEAKCDQMAKRLLRTVLKEGQ